MTTSPVSLHATDRINPVSALSIGRVAKAIRGLAGSAVALLAANVQRRMATPDFDHFSDRRLHDIGFERDWDGSIIPTVRG